MKVHLGCGNRRLPGFVHIDPNKDCDPDYVGSAEKIPLECDTVDLLYFCHGLEHVRKKDIDKVICEFVRVLRPGCGTLRLSMPDFAVIADLYLHENVSLVRLGCINGGQRNAHDVHYAVYDYEHLACLLHKHFYNIRRWDPNDVHPPHYDDFSFARINERLISLNVEAICK